MCASICAAHAPPALLQIHWVFHPLSYFLQCVVVRATELDCICVSPRPKTNSRSVGCWRSTRRTSSAPVQRVSSADRPADVPVPSAGRAARGNFVITCTCASMHPTTTTSANVEKIDCHAWTSRVRMRVVKLRVPHRRRRRRRCVR